MSDTKIYTLKKGKQMFIGKHGFKVHQPKAVCFDKEDAECARLDAKAIEKFFVVTDADFSLKPGESRDMKSGATSAPAPAANSVSGELKAVLDGGDPSALLDFVKDKGEDAVPFGTLKEVLTSLEVKVDPRTTDVKKLVAKLEEYVQKG